MDLLTHALLTRKLIDKRRDVLLAGIGPDVPWYLTYPLWVIAQGKARHALTTSEWPEAPHWVETLHHASHSLPVALLAATAIRALSGRWPGRALAAWALHIVVDIPTHSRRFWGPRFLWPLSDVAVEGVPWAEITSRVLSAVLSTLGVRSRGQASRRRRDAGIEAVKRIAPDAPVEDTTLFEEKTQ